MKTPQDYYIASLTSEEHKDVKKHKLEVNAQKGSQWNSSKVSKVAVLQLSSS